MLAVDGRAAKDEMRVEVLAELKDFTLHLLPGEPLVRFKFDHLSFHAGSSGKPDVDVVLQDIEFLGFLGFVETLRELIPFDGFSDPPFLDVTAEGLSAGFTLALPNVSVGVFNLSNMSLGADVQVPFLGKAVTVGFNFCTRERPFTLAVVFIGGGGWFLIRLSPDGLDVLELGLEAGAILAVDFGVASGSISAMLGIYMRLEGDEGSLSGYFRLRGEVDVLGLISASIELYLELHYEFDTGKMARPGAAHDQGRGVLLLHLGDHLGGTPLRRLGGRSQLQGRDGAPGRLLTGLVQVLPRLRGSVSMATELFTVVALPHSVAAGADYHVSLFVSPRLTPDDVGRRAPGLHATSRTGPHCSMATRRSSSSTRSGRSPIQPSLDPLDPDFWDAIFPPDTPVRAPRDVDFSDRHWRTFRAGEIHDAAKLLHVVAMFSDPTSPPLPSIHPLGRLMGQLGVGSTHRREYDESEVTRRLDRLIGETGEPGEVAIPLPELEALVDRQDNPLTAARHAGPPRPPLLRAPRVEA